MYLVIALNATGIGFESLPIQRDGRVAPVPMTPPNDAEGAPGPSPLGTGESARIFHHHRPAPPTLRAVPTESNGFNPLLNFTSFIAMSAR